MSGFKLFDNAGKGFTVTTEFFTEESAAPKWFSLSASQRFYGWATCAALGFVLSILGTIWLFLGSLTLFATFYGLGVIVSLAATGFVVGFFKQAKMMFDMKKPIRVAASSIFLLLTGLIFVGAFVIDNGGLCIALVILQYISYWFYITTYIPIVGSSLAKYISF